MLTRGRERPIESSMGVETTTTRAREDGFSLVELLSKFDDTVQMYVGMPVTAGLRMGPSNAACTDARPELRTSLTNPCRMPRFATPFARIAIRSSCRPPVGRRKTRPCRRLSRDTSAACRCSRGWKPSSPIRAASR